METGKAGVGAACCYQNQWAETGIESLWALHSDGGDLRAWWVCTLMDDFTFHFKQTLFIRKKVEGRGLEFKEKANQIKSCSILSSVSWAVDVSPWSTVAQIPCWLLMVSSATQRANCLWLPGVRVGHTFSSWNNSFLHALMTKFISY